MGRRKTDREKNERRYASAARAKSERKQRRVPSRRRMNPTKALTPTRGIDPPEPGTQGIDPQVEEHVVGNMEIGDADKRQEKEVETAS
jgi:hypothetical protein